MNHIFEILKSIFIDFSLVVYGLCGTSSLAIVQLVVETFLNIFNGFVFVCVYSEYLVAVRGCNCALIILHLNAHSTLDESLASTTANNEKIDYFSFRMKYEMSVRCDGAIHLSRYALRHIRNENDGAAFE